MILTTGPCSGDAHNAASVTFQSYTAKGYATSWKCNSCGRMGLEMGEPLV